MSNILGRRPQSADGVTPDSVLRKPGYVKRHRGSFFDFETHLREHVNAVLRGGWKARGLLKDNLLDFISDDRNLAIAWCHARDHGGPAAGSDGDTFDNYDPEIPPWPLLSEWQSMIRSGGYVTDPDRVCFIPKSSGVGTRRITILTIRDRVVNRAAMQVLQEVFDRFFDQFSFGCRPSPRIDGVLRRGTLPAIATGMALFDRGYTHWVAEDLRDAFGRVPLAGMMEVLGTYLNIAKPDDHKLTRFIASLLAGASGAGLRQGSPLSAFLMNCYLDHHLDRYWRKWHPGCHLIRYVDDLLIACRSRADAISAHDELTQLLRPKGMLTKFGRVRSVRSLDVRRPVAWLGFYFHGTRAGSLRVRPGDRGWENLDLALTEPGLKPDDAENQMAAWLTAMAPAYGHCNHRVVYDRLAHHAARVGIDDFPNRDQVLNYWRVCHTRWQALKAATQTTLVAQQLLPEPVVAR